MKNILIIGAHYDDTELGAGGTAARMVAEGKNVYKITLTNTVVYSESLKLDITNERARQNSKGACEIIGLKEIDLETAQYGQLVYTQKMMQDLETIIRKYEIDTVFCHFNEDYQTDHIAASQICRTAARHCDNILMYQSNPYITPQTFDPNIFVDITEYVEKKRKALLCYDSEHDRQGRLFETNILRNQIWGYGNHCGYAEGFVAIKYCV